MDKEDLRKTLSANRTKFELCYRLHTHPSLAFDIPAFETSDAFFPREVDQELANHRMAAKRGVLEHLKDRISDTLTFEDCCNSDLMNKTLWSSNE
ncbi:hypothetical protein RAB80_005755 [Fusarium oxysporum f. sp. vasinfectum]|nr:hypothetical protein RAB80_005755 [Fusarium oxysporum f. sp. vasinfectum]KAK2939558.1 hypothetical protein FoTM2_002776 [Fusarium oxysporum f. sp. vasinfectum]